MALELNPDNILFILEKHFCIQRQIDLYLVQDLFLPLSQLFGEIFVFCARSPESAVCSFIRCNINPLSDLTPVHFLSKFSCNVIYTIPTP